MSCILRNSFTVLIRGKISVQQIRSYPRWSHRRPVKVFSPDEYEKLEEKFKLPTQNISNHIEQTSNEDKPKIQWRQPIVKNDQVNSGTDSVKYRMKPKKVLQPLTTKSKSSTDMLETVIDQEGNFVYQKMKDNDARVGMILSEVKSHKEKEKKDLILLEGKRLIKDALQSGCGLKYILFSRKQEIEYLKPYLPKFGVQLFKMPYREMQMWSDLSTTPGIMGIFKTPNVENYKPKNSLPLTVICENIREPGNLGTILRLCAGVGCNKVVLLKGCVHLWDTKVLRGAAGAHFKLQLHRNQEWSDIKNNLQPNSQIFLADNRLISVDDKGNLNDLEEFLTKIPILPYYSVDFKSAAHIILIVGGESHGISEELYCTASEMGGVRLNVPLSNNIDSLNVGAALAIISFEVKRQLSQLKIH